MFTAFTDCANKNLPLEAIFNKLMVADAEGNPVLKSVNANLAMNGLILDARKTDLTKIAHPVKASAGRLLGWNIINPNATAVYVKFFDKASAGVVLGTDTPVLTLMIPATSSVFIAPNTVQHEFTVAITVLATAALADNNTADVTTPLMVNIKYN